MDILPVLRAATATAHLQLEESVQIEKRVAARPGYVWLLERFYGFYGPLEKRLLALPGWREIGLDPDERRKTPWLEADLLALGIAGAQIEKLPTCTRLPPTNNLAQGVGCLYVLEGATLGGRQITTLLQTSPVPVAARHFFGSYGREVGRRWKEFVAAMDVYARQCGEAGCAEIVEAARETFACLKRWTVEHSPPDEQSG